MMSTTSHKDPTFRSYSAEQAEAYAADRLSYASAIYDTILDHHRSTGGQFKLVLDCGCGPGNATRDLARSFDEAIGTDAGASMVATAKSIGGKSKSGADIRFEIVPGENLSQVQGLEPESVDLLTVAMAVHWFEMDKFWLEAAKVLNPGGTVAIWTRASSFCHPSTPNAPKVMEIFIRLERETLAPYELPGNRLSRDCYDNLPLPWTIPAPVTAFPENQFVRHVYDRDGVLSNGVSFFGGGQSVDLDMVEKGLGSASMVIRWREAHPDLVGTDGDVLKQFVREVREALGPGNETVLQGSATAILLFKKAI